MEQRITRTQLSQAVEAGIAAARPDIPSLYVRRLRKFVQQTDSVMVGTFTDDATCGCPLNRVDAPGCGPTTLNDSPAEMPDWTWTFIDTFDTTAQRLSESSPRCGRYTVVA